MRSKKERQLGAQKRAEETKPTLQNTSALVETLPLTIVDVERMGKAAFRDLLKTLSFEGLSFEPTGRVTDVSVTLPPEVSETDGPCLHIGVSKNNRRFPGNGGEADV